MFYDIKFISLLAEKYPALARACETGLIAFFYYAIWVLISHELFSINAALIALFTPLHLALNKRLRDLEKIN